MMRHFRSSVAVAVSSAVVAFLYDGMAGLVVIVALGCLEVSLSMDNAVVNAKALEIMSPVWQRRFLTWGMLIAVFGMRLLFPLIVVSASAWITPFAALNMALHDPVQYGTVLAGAHIQVAGFGGAFLLMLFFDYFMDSEKEVHWIGPIERGLHRFGHVDHLGVALTVIVVFLASVTLETDDCIHMLQCGMTGIVGYILAEGAADLVGGTDEVARLAARAGFAGFFYLEVQDASFSFDGVIGALAVSNNLVLIALGLGIGAMFVRSLTLMLVDSHSLTELPYLEHGAFWAVGVMALVMFLKLHIEIPDYATGVIMAVLIGGALGSSILHNRRERNTAPVRGAVPKASRSPEGFTA
jgi:hypothetical protein